MQASFSRIILENLQTRPAKSTAWEAGWNQADEADVVEAIAELRRQLGSRSLPPNLEGWPLFFQMLFGWLKRDAGRMPLRSPLRESVVGLYRDLGGACPVRYQLMVLLAVSGQVSDLQPLASLVRDDPPDNHDAAAAPFVPLMHPASQAACMFPLLADCLESPSLAAPVLDLANYLFRSGIVPNHPLKAESGRLVALLRGLTARLESLGLDSGPTAEPRRSAAFGLMTLIALADALALIGSPEAIGPLTDALELRHRRIRVEVAAALARLGEETGKQVLLACAAEPVTRLRAIRYARELSCDQELPQAFVTDVSIAEAELVSYLAQAHVMGVPPSECELLDRRTLNWPGYEEPRDCYLFRFTYRATQGGESMSYANLGIAGPLAHAFFADLMHLDLDDVYAAFAGWQAEHAEIWQQDFSSLSPVTPPYRMLLHRVDEMGYVDIDPIIAGHFFGDPVLVGVAVSSDGQTGAFVVDPFDLDWFPQPTGRRPLTAEDVFCIYKGRRLLRQFNSLDFPT